MQNYESIIWYLFSDQHTIAHVWASMLINIYRTMEIAFTCLFKQMWYVSPSWCGIQISQILGKSQILHNQIIGTINSPSNTPTNFENLIMPLRIGTEFFLLWRRNSKIGTHEWALRSYTYFYLHTNK